VGDVRGEVVAGVRRRHSVAAGSYAVTLGVFWGVPAWLLAAKAGAPLGFTIGVALMAWGPSSLWATLAEFGRLRRDGALAGATALAALYYLYLAYVTLTHGTLEITGKDAVLAILPVLVSTMIGAAPAMREQ
jgi:hypothetical protein